MDNNLHNIDGDGISPAFYHLLWSKDELNYGLTLNIPDTIIYKFGQPVSWYFTARDGKVKKKNKHNLMNVKIEESFTKRTVGFDVVACYISETKEGETEIEFLDRKGLRKMTLTFYTHNTQSDFDDASIGVISL